MTLTCVVFLVRFNLSRPWTSLRNSCSRFCYVFNPENYLLGVREDPRVGLHAAQRCLGDVNQTNPAASSRRSCSTPLVRPRVNNHDPAANHQVVLLQWGC